MKKGAGDLQHKILSYWWEQTGDMDMILTFVSENGMVTLDRYSTFRGFDGKRGVGLCQMYETWHSDFIYKNGNKSEGFSDDMLDWKKQSDRCIGIWRDAKARNRIQQTFHAFATRERARNVLIFNF